MSCKRKRSVDESIVSACSFGSFATPEAQSPTPIASGYATNMEAPMSRGMGWDFSNLGRVKSGDWIQRTRKRVRDNRPDEHVIHGTYRRYLLYVAYSNAAQKRPWTSYFPPNASNHMLNPSPLTLCHRTKCSLHRSRRNPRSMPFGTLPLRPHNLSNHRCNTLTMPTRRGVKIATRYWSPMQTTWM